MFKTAVLLSSIYRKSWSIPAGVPSVVHFKLAVGSYDFKCIPLPPAADVTSTHLMVFLARLRAVIKLPRNFCIWACSLLCRTVELRLGTAMLAKIPIMATTIINSIKVKPARIVADQDPCGRLLALINRFGTCCFMTTSFNFCYGLLLRPLARTVIGLFTQAQYLKARNDPFAVLWQFLYFSST